MELWFIYAVGAAVFAALTTIFAKIGIKNVDSNLATAIRTVVVLVFAWVMVFVAGSQDEIRYIRGETWLFLALSAFATGGSWLCYFRALKLGSVNKVVPIDKSSTILTMILAFIFLSEPVGLMTAIGMVLMGAGTWLMLDIKKESVSTGKGSENAGIDSESTDIDSDNANIGSEDIGKNSVSTNIDSESTGKDIKHSGEIWITKNKPAGQSWLLFAVMSAVFASLTAIFGRIGVANIDASLWTAMRTIIVGPLTWLMVIISGSGGDKIKKVSRRCWLFLVLSGASTGASWLFFFHALQIGNASHVVPIDKLSIVLVMTFARLFLGERFSIKSIIGLVLLMIGTLSPILLQIPE